MFGSPVAQPGRGHEEDAPGSMYRQSTYTKMEDRPLSCQNSRPSSYFLGRQGFEAPRSFELPSYNRPAPYPERWLNEPERPEPVYYNRWLKPVEPEAPWSYESLSYNRPAAYPERYMNKPERSEPVYYNNRSWAAEKDVDYSPASYCPDADQPRGYYRSGLQPGGPWASYRSCELERDGRPQRYAAGAPVYAPRSSYYGDARKPAFWPGSPRNYNVGSRDYDPEYPRDHGYGLRL